MTTTIEQNRQTRYGIARRRPAPATNSGFRPDIEGLRAVAVGLVVAAHAGIPALAGGFVGVDVFFVISGFLITTLLARELRHTGTISLRRFYARRFTRLLPASTLVLLATLLAAWLWLPITRLAGLGWDAVAASGYAVNLRLAIVGTDYFGADSPPSALQHFWSLAVEEQFYLLWPLLLLGVASVAGPRSRRSTRLAVTAVSGVFVASFALSLTYSADAASWSYFGPHTRAWELAAGALLALAAPRLTRIAPPVAAAASWLGLAAIGTAAFLFDDGTAFPGHAALLPVAGTVLVMAGGTTGARHGAFALLRLRPFQFVGRLSYGFYLWHWPVLLIAPFAFDRTGSIAFNGLAMLGALGLAWATYRLVEDPLRRLPVWKHAPWRAIGLGATLTAATTAAAVVAIVVLVPLATPRGAPATDTTAALSNATDANATLSGLISASADQSMLPSNLTPTLDAVGGDRPAVYRDDECHLDLTDSRTRNGICSYGDVDAERTMVLFGDSHAAQWLPTLSVIARDTGWRLVPLTRSGCPVATVEIFHDHLKRRYTECSGWRAESFALIERLDPEFIVTSSINGHAPIDGTGARVPDQDGAMVDGWETTFDRLQDSGRELTYIMDTPHFGRPVPDCVASHPTEVEECAVASADARLDPDRAQRIAELASANDIDVIDPLPLFCAEGICPAVIGNTLILRDSNHITTVYMRAIAPLLEPRLPIMDG
ncbi:acyltransferase family protein [Stackebrandtia soli]|uniref:acyltransferase family protein n=1 Tax=Stackebrandtia soli TaxID=1892856 RepID=UPI0039E83200